MENTLGEKLHRIRKEKGLTLQKVADEIGCSASYLYRIEKNQRTGINYKLKEKLFKIYGIKETESHNEQVKEMVSEVKDLLKKIENLL